MPVTFPPGLTAEYMFGLLGYSTWNIYEGRTFLGQVTLNAVDRSVSWVPAEEPDLMTSEFHRITWKAWMKWLRRHRLELL